jgi:hypothetical protein
MHGHPKCMMLGNPSCLHGAQMFTSIIVMDPRSHVQQLVHRHIMNLFAEWHQHPYNMLDSLQHKHARLKIGT